MTTRILIGDVRDQLKTLADNSVHCVVTSPPYFGLRDYGTASWEGGDPDCRHSVGGQVQDSKAPGAIMSGMRPGADASRCRLCGAARKDKQIGLEPTPAEFVAVMVDVFSEVRRVLRPDGTLWLNLGDSYAAHPGQRKTSDKVGAKQETNAGSNTAPSRHVDGLKAKDLIGVPWRVAFALQADGWVLRQEIIWAKPNPMPESVTDRCTKAHESLFLFAKAQWVGPEPGRFAHISDDDARWLALCIDTEGCIVVKRTKQNDGGADAFAPQVSFGSTSRALMERFQAIIGHGNLAEREGQNAPMVYWQAGNNIAADFLRRIYPFLIVKQRQARIGIHVDTLTYYRGGKKPARKQRTEAENDALVSLWARGKECNHFGAPDLSDVPEPEFGRWGAGARYHYDAEAIREPHSEIVAAAIEKYAGTPGLEDARRAGNIGSAPDRKDSGKALRINNNAFANPDGRNRRSVWTVATQPFKEAHFATFPPDLIEPCIKAGCPKDCCAKCGAPVVRQIERSGGTIGESWHNHQDDLGRGQRGGDDGTNKVAAGWKDYRRETTGWSPSCSCDAGLARGVVLDPFGGAGTTALVADRLQRDSILIELKPEYAALAEARIFGDAPLFAKVAAE